MSKLDAARALREARYAQTVSGTTKPEGKPVAKPALKPALKPVVKTPAKTPAKPQPMDASGDALCGHRNMGGRTCTREQGHTAKSHRYS